MYSRGDANLSTITMHSSSRLLASYQRARLLMERSWPSMIRADLIFNQLQNFRSEAQHIHYFIFDLLVFAGRDLTRLPLNKRRELLKSLKVASGRIRIAEQFEARAIDMLDAVRQQKLEGVIAKRKDSLYEAGKRTG